MKRALKQTKANEPGSEQRIRAASVGGRTLRQIPARQGNPVRCQTISKADGEAAVIRILWLYSIVSLAISQHHMYLFLLLAGELKGTEVQCPVNSISQIHTKGEL